MSSSTLFGLELLIPTTPTLSSPHPYFYGGFATFFSMPITPHCSSCAAKCSTSISTCTPRRRSRLQNFRSLVLPSSITSGTCVGKDEDHDDVEVTNGYTMTKLCDKMIEYFMQEKPQTKDWRKVLVFRDDWKKYRDSFFKRCQVRADAERDPLMKKKLNLLARKIKKVDDEMEMNSFLLKEIQDNPLDLNAIVARRRKDFTGEFFRYLSLLLEAHDGLEDRDVMARVGAKCLSAVRVYDSTVEHLDSLEVAQSKFDDILNSSSLEVACEKINHLAKVKELDSSLILLINKAWAAAKESAKIKNEVKGIMYYIYKEARKALKNMAPPEIKLLKHLLNIVDPEERFSALATSFSPGDEHEMKDANAVYTCQCCVHVKDIMYYMYKETRKALKNMAPPEIKLLKHLLNIVDPEERFSALATSFSPGDEHEMKEANAVYTTPKELHKWITMLLDSYYLNKEETDLIEARQMSDPMVIQRLFILKETIEQEYLKQHKVTNEKEPEPQPEEID